jgi:Flp pilus assembly pilin Flp
VLEWFKVAKVRSEAGQSTAEYGLVLSLVSIAAISVVSAISLIVKGQFQGIVTFLSGLAP